MELLSGSTSFRAIPDPLIPTIDNDRPMRYCFSGFRRTRARRRAVNGKSLGFVGRKDPHSVCKGDSGMRRLLRVAIVLGIGLGGSAAFAGKATTVKEIMGTLYKGNTALL